jgi:type II secretory pathway component PulJ
METQLRLVSSLCETSQRNLEKQQEINQLRETIGTLETQFSELGFSPISCEAETGKFESTPNVTLSAASQNEITEYNRNQQALAIVEQSK